MKTLETIVTQETKTYFKSECQKCGVLLVIPVNDQNDWDYYLCQTCAFAKIGALPNERA